MSTAPAGLVSLLLVSLHSVSVPISVSLHSVSLHLQVIVMLTLVFASNEDAATAM